MARSLHIHPNILDFWLIAVYCEFDIRGSMQAARNILLQGIRRNPDESEFYFEYLKFELRVLKKLHTRKKLLEANEEIKIVEEKSEKEEENKMNESVPSIIYSSSSKSITKQFRLNVQLHFRIKELVSMFSNVIDTTQLLNNIEDHINLVLFIECKSEVMQYLLSHSNEVDQVDMTCNDFLSKTIPDLDSFRVLLNSLGKLDWDWKLKYKIANNFYSKFCEAETDNYKIEIGATMLFEFIDEFQDNINDIYNILADLHIRFPDNFPITVHYCKNALLSGDYDVSDVPMHREYLATLTNAIKQNQDNK